MSRPAPSPPGLPGVLDKAADRPASPPPSLSCLPCKVGVLGQECDDSVKSGRKAVQTCQAPCTLQSPPTFPNLPSPHRTKHPSKSCLTTRPVGAHSKGRDLGFSFWLVSRGPLDPECRGPQEGRARLVCGTGGRVTGLRRRDGVGRGAAFEVGADRRAQDPWRRIEK